MASVDLVTATLQTGGPCPVVITSDAISVARLHAAAGLGRIETGLILRPTMALELIRGLLLLGLAVFGIDHQIVLSVPWTVGRRRRLIRIVRRIHDRVTVLIRLPRVVNIVGVVIRIAAEPYRRVIRRQYRDHESRRRPHHHEPRSARRIPNSAVEVIAIAAPIIGAVVALQ